MGIFICEKCGKLDNTAHNHNYHLASGNKRRILAGKKPNTHFKPEFAYFENHVCCSDCCNGLIFSDDSGVIKKDKWDHEEKPHWTKYGKEKLLEWEARHDGSMMNATEYFKNLEESV